MTETATTTMTYKVHGCGLSVRKIKATSPADAARLFQFDVNSERYRGAFVQEGVITITDAHGKPCRFSWELTPLE